MSNKSFKTKPTGEKDFDDIIDSLGVRFSEKEINTLKTLRGTMLNDMGSGGFFEGLFTMYRVKSNEKLSRATKFNSWMMIGITVGLLFVGIVGLLINK